MAYFSKLRVSNLALLIGIPLVFGSAAPGTRQFNFHRIGEYENGDEVLLEIAPDSCDVLICFTQGKHSINLLDEPRIPNGLAE